MADQALGPDLPLAGSENSEEEAPGGKGARRPTQKRSEGPYSRRRCGEAPPAAFRRAIGEFNQGEFFEQHETLEELWREESDEVRYLYQGILLVGVGCYHLLRGNYVGATGKLARGLELLRWFEPTCQGVDVARLVADAERLEAALRALGPGRLADLDRRLLPRVSARDE